MTRMIFIVCFAVCCLSRRAWCGEQEIKPEALAFFEKSQQEAESENVEQSVKNYLKAVQVDSSVPFRRRFAAMYWNAAETIRRKYGKAFEDSFTALTAAHEAANEERHSFGAGKYKVFNPDNPAYKRAQAAYAVEAKKIAPSLKFYEKAEENYASVLKADSGHKDLDAAAHQALCLNVKNDEIYLRARARQALVAVVTNYKPSGEAEQALYDRCKEELEKRDK